MDETRALTKDELNDLLSDDDRHVGGEDDKYQRLR